MKRLSVPTRAKAHPTVFPDTPGGHRRNKTEVIYIEASIPEGVSLREYSRHRCEVIDFPPPAAHGTQMLGEGEVLEFRAPCSDRDKPARGSLPLLAPRAGSPSYDGPKEAA